MTSDKGVIGDCVEIGSLCTDIFDGPHATPKKTDAGPIFLGISNLANGRLDLVDAERLSEEDFIKWTRRVVPGSGDVVFSYVLGDDTLRDIAREIVETVRGNVSIDWTVKESVRAKLRALVKRVLRKHGYPPDKAEKATQTVLEQAELIAKDRAQA